MPPRSIGRTGAKLVVIALAWLVLACGGDGQGGVVPANAFERPNQDAAIKNLEAAKRTADEDAAKHAAADEAQMQTLADAVAIVPDPKPRSIALACAAAAEAMDALVQRQFARDAAGLAEWNGDKSTTLADFRRKCVDEDTIETAACKAHAMKHADDRLVGDAFGLMERCDQKYAPSKPTDPKGEAKRPR